MSKNSLKDKIALVTGAAKRLGRATALALAREGVNIMVHYNRSDDAADELCRELKMLGVNAWKVQANLQKTEESETLIEKAYKLAGPITILINNASIYPKGKLEEITLDDISLNIRINVWAPFVISREFAKRTKEGKIVNFLDTRIKGYDWAHTAYHLSKHMLALLTRMTALTFAPRITVNAVAPGLILPPEGEDKSYLEKLKETVPLKNYGSPKDVTDAVLFLLKSDYITGQIIYVDGGRHLKEAVYG